MTIHKRARGESWLVRAAIRVRRAIRETYVVRVAHIEGTHQSSSCSDNPKPTEVFGRKEKEVPVAVQLKTGKTVKVELGELKNYLEKNKDTIVFQHDPDMPTRRRIAKQGLEQSVD